MSEAARPDEATARATHHAPVVRRPADHPGEAGRFANVTRMVFHPSPEHPNEPNAGTVTYEPGAGFALHMHDFAQLWYVLEGECRFGGHRLTAGDMVYMEDPHFEHEIAYRHRVHHRVHAVPGTDHRRPAHLPGPLRRPGRRRRASSRICDDRDLQPTPCPPPYPLLGAGFQPVRCSSRGR